MADCAHRACPDADGEGDHCHPRPAEGKCDRGGDTGPAGAGAGAAVGAEEEEGTLREKPSQQPEKHRTQEKRWATFFQCLASSIF